MSACLRTRFRTSVRREAFSTTRSTVPKRPEPICALRGTVKSSSVKARAARASSSVSG